MHKYKKFEKERQVVPYTNACINATIEAVLELWKLSEESTLAFELVEEREDGSETVIYKMKQENGCHTHQYVGWEYCAPGWNYGWFFTLKTKYNASHI